MNIAALAQRLTLPLLFAIACNGEFRFDDGPELPVSTAGSGTLPPGGSSGEIPSALVGAGGAPSGLNGASGASGASENADGCAHCSEYGLVCETDWRVCVECTQDYDCAAANPYCDTTLHRCVSCTLESGCATGSTCEGWSHSCLRSCAVEVDPDQDCGHSGRLCDSSRSLLCVECFDDDDCPNGLHCADRARCAECGHDSDCSGMARFCDPVTFSCVACRDFQDCGMMFVCDPKTHTCLANDD